MANKAVNTRANGEPSWAAAPLADVEVELLVAAPVFEELVVELLVVAVLLFKEVLLEKAALVLVVTEDPDVVEVAVVLPVLVEPADDDEVPPLISN